jgi:hypothetical protein
MGPPNQHADEKNAVAGWGWGPGRLEFWLQGTMLKVAPVSTKYLSLVNSSVKKIKPAFAGKCMSVAVACVGKATEPKGVRWRISFLTKNRAKCTC